MTKATEALNEANLYQAGGECTPMELCMEKIFGRTPEGVEEAKKKRGINVDGVGSFPTYGNVKVGEKLDYNMYPSPDIDLEDKCAKSYTVAGHRSNASFGISRLLYFDGDNPNKTENSLRKEHNNQLALRRWWLQNKDCIVPGYKLNLVYIPPKHHFRYAYVCNQHPIEGLTYDVVLKRTGTVLVADVDGSVVGSQCIAIEDPDTAWNDCFGEIIQIVLKTIPPCNEDNCKPGKGHLDQWCVMVAADVFCPMTGA